MSERLRLRVAQGSEERSTSERPRGAAPLARTLDEWKAWLEQAGEAPYRAKQIFRWIHRDGVLDPAQMTNLSLALRQRLAEAGVATPFREVAVRRSSDGTRKLLLGLNDERSIECVLIPRDNALDADDPEEDEEDEPGEPRGKRPVTLCISTQVGCAMGCIFCASGQAGLMRALGAHEVVAQVLVAQRYLDEGERLRNLVFMGMGEPLHHYAETARAIRLLTSEAGQAMSLRRITVSTVGLIRGIEKLGRDFEGKVGLAISLHAPDSETRDRIIPMNAHHPLPDLLDALRRYPLPKRRRITIEYTLIDGVNDSREHALRLVRCLRGLAVKVNLIPMNPIAASSLRRPDDERVREFRQVLADQRVSCSLRQTRGDDVDAACGQLALAN